MGNRSQQGFRRKGISNAVSLKPKYGRKEPVRHEIPKVVRRTGPEVIQGTVRSVDERTGRVLLWNCPEQRWYRASTKEQITICQEALTNNKSLMVEVNDGEIKEIAI